MNKEEVITKLKEQKEVRPRRTMNGNDGHEYTVKTYVCDYIADVILSIIAVYKDENSTEILQISVDVENIYGTLLFSRTLNLKHPDYLDNIAKEYLEHFESITKVNKGKTING